MNFEGETWRIPLLCIEGKTTAEKGKLVIKENITSQKLKEERSHYLREGLRKGQGE